jgi:tRNA pseudouridine55 synthase
MIVTSANSLIEPQTGDSDDEKKNISSDVNRNVANHDATHRDEQPARAGKQLRPNNQPRRDKRDVHGWVVLDKPIGMTSTHAVAVVKRLFQAKRAGHAGTLDPLASGGLPIALGEATKTVPFVMDGRGTRHRRYRRPGRQNE